MLLGIDSAVHVRRADPKPQLDAAAFEQHQAEVVDLARAEDDGLFVEAEFRDALENYYKAIEGGAK